MEEKFESIWLNDRPATTLRAIKKVLALWSAYNDKIKEETFTENSTFNILHTKYNTKVNNQWFHAYVWRMLQCDFACSGGMKYAEIASTDVIMRG